MLPKAVAAFNFFGLPQLPTWSPHSNKEKISQLEKIQNMALNYDATWWKFLNYFWNFFIIYIYIYKYYNKSYSGTTLC